MVRPDVASTITIALNLISALESLRFAFILHAMYLLFVPNYGKIEFLTYPVW